jgi:hypothetical protein
MHITEALRIQLDVQRRLNEQMEVLYIFQESTIFRDDDLEHMIFEEENRRYKNGLLERIKKQKHKFWCVLAADTAKSAGEDRGAGKEAAEDVRGPAPGEPE